MNKKSRNCGIKNTASAVLYFTNNYTINTHKNQYKLASQFLSKYASVREIRYLRNDKIYTGNRRLKKSQKAGQKQTPQEFCGVLFITGGTRNLLPLAYERPAPDARTKGLKTGKNREFLQKTVLLVFLHNSD